LSALRVGARSPSDVDVRRENYHRRQMGIA
jgi:hypothetical protein